VRALLLALALVLPLRAEEVNVRFHCDPVDAEVYMVDTADHYLGPADQPLKVDLQRYPQGVHFRFERPGFAPRTTLDRVTAGRLQQGPDGLRYPPDSLGAVELEPLTDWHSRLIQGGLWLRRWGMWLLVVPGLGLVLARRRPAPEQETTATPGLRVGDYQLLDQIGKGGMSEVYRARRADDFVAVKLMQLELSRSPEAAERFQREVQAHLALSHPNLPLLIDWGEFADGRLYLVMELLQGETLKERLVRLRTLEPVEVVAIISALAEALDYLHDQGFIHRDVKPSNVFCLVSGRIKLTDMGIARNQELAPLTNTGAAVGTPHYMAPEQISGEAQPASDQYALGVMTFEMLAGRRPFQGSDVQAILQLQLSQAAPPLSQFIPEAPSELDDALLRMLAKNPQARFADCRTAAAALAQALTGAESDDTLV
jgi:hypothetical protein